MTEKSRYENHGNFIFPNSEKFLYSFARQSNCEILQILSHILLFLLSLRYAGLLYAAGTAHSSAHCWDLATLMCCRVWNTCCKSWTFKNSFIYSSLTELSEVALPSSSSITKRRGGKKWKSTVQLRLFQSVLQFLFSSYLHTDNSSKVKKGFAPLGP